MSQPGEATSAGIYAAVQGDPDTYPADRAAAEQLLAICPELGDNPRTGRPGLARANRNYLGAAVLLAIGHLDIRQFIDLGCGHPAKGGVLESVLEADGEARVVCVDNDPDITSAAYGHQAALDEQGITRARMALADLTDPEQVTGHPAMDLIDFGEPVFVSFGLVLHYWPAAVSAGIVARYMGRLVPGSGVVITVTAVPDRGKYAAMRQAWQAGTGGDFCDYHQPGAVAGLFGGLRVLNPGAGPVDGLRCAGDGRAYLAGGIGRKP